MALASRADYEEIFNVSLDVGEAVQVERLLDIASSTLLASAYGQTISEATTEDLTLSPSGGVVRFPQRPVTAVASVTYDGDALTEGDDYRWTEGGNGQPAYLIRRIDGVDSYWADDVVVTYTHGYATVPDQIVAAVVFMAAAMKQTAADGGVPVVSRSEQIDDYSESVRYAEAAGVTVPGWAFPLLEELFGVAGATSVPVVRDR